MTLCRAWVLDLRYFWLYNYGMVKKKAQQMTNEDVAARLELLMNSLERVADELEELGYLDSSKKLDELICELDVEMCWLA